MVTPDALSHLSSLDEFEVPDMNVNVHHLIRIFPAKVQEFKNGTAKDKVLQQSSQQVVKCWPDSVKEVDLKVKPYWSLLNEILVENGLVLLRSCHSPCRIRKRQNLAGNPQRTFWHRKMQAVSQILCSLAKHL